MGKKPHNELPKIYSTHDIFVLASDSDPIWAVIQESMAYWCSILVSDTCGASCYIKDWENWYIFETNNKKSFIEKANLLIKNKNLLNWFKEKSTEIISKEYSCNNQELLEMYYKKINDFINK